MLPSHVLWKRIVENEFKNMKTEEIKHVVKGHYILPFGDIAFDYVIYAGNVIRN